MERNVSLPHMSSLYESNDIFSKISCHIGLNANIKNHRDEMTTDVFCAAGLILPDKGGRQLTVGGWNGDSNFGVRLYTPDGSDGVNGTNQWQENTSKLTLQLPRWYPSAMIMANGSIMIVRISSPLFGLEIMPASTLWSFLISF